MKNKTKLALIYSVYNFQRQRPPKKLVCGYQRLMAYEKLIHHSPRTKKKSDKIAWRLFPIGDYYGHVRRASTIMSNRQLFHSLYVNKM